MLDNVSLVRFLTLALDILARTQEDKAPAIKKVNRKTKGADEHVGSMMA